MKKILFLLVLICTISFSKAESFTTKNSNSFTKIKPALSAFKKADTEINEECTVTVEGKIIISGSGITVTCSATSDNCTAAATNAVNCVKATIKAVRASIL